MRALCLQRCLDALLWATVAVIAVYKDDSVAEVMYLESFQETKSAHSSRIKSSTYSSMVTTNDIKKPYACVFVANT